MRLGETITSGVCWRETHCRGGDVGEGFQGVTDTLTRVKRKGPKQVGVGAKPEGTNKQSGEV